MKRTAFTMLELIFVIVVIGILASVALPRLAATRDDAQIAKGRSDVSAIRSAIVSERQGRLLRGDSAYINKLDDATQNWENETLFDNNGTPANTILMYGVTSKKANGHWMKTGATTYTYQIIGQVIPFTYTQTNGTFDCNRSTEGVLGEYCKKLVD